MTWLFTLALFLHVLAVLLLVAAMALQATMALLMPRARSVGEVRTLLGASRWVPRLFAPATALLLASGTCMAVVLGLAGARWGWMLVAFVALVALAVWGKASGKRRNRKLARLVAQSGAEVSPDLRRALDAPTAMVHLALDVWFLIGIVVLMVYEPRAVVAVAVMVAALLATLAVRLLGGNRIDRHHPDGPLTTDP